MAAGRAVVARGVAIEEAAMGVAMVVVARGVAMVEAAMGRATAVAKTAAESSHPAAIRESHSRCNRSRGHRG